MRFEAASTRVRFKGLAVAVVCLWAMPALARQAETSRAATIAEQQHAKAETMQPYRPSRAELVLRQIEEGRFPLIGAPNGFYPGMGSIYPGGGLGFGGGFRRATGDRSRFDVHGLFSPSTFKRVEATFRSPGHAEQRLDIDARAGWLDAPRIAFYGLGADSSAENRSVYRLRERYVETALTWKQTRRVHLGLAGGYESYTDDSGTGGQFPSIEEVFTPETAPRLGEDPEYATGRGSLTLLWTESPLYARRGGYYRFTYSGYRRLDSPGEFAYTQNELVQHIPLRREVWVVSLRARTLVLLGDDDDAPYFLFPSLGSGTTLRAYQTHRFRDRHTLLFSGEWRWIPNFYALDLALFADAGTVSARWRDLPSSPLHANYGVGIRVHTPASTVLRVEIAHGDEGTRLVFTSSAPF